MWLADDCAKFILSLHLRINSHKVASISSWLCEIISFSDIQNKTCSFGVRLMTAGEKCISICASFGFVILSVSSEIYCRQFVTKLWTFFSVRSTGLWSSKIPFKLKIFVSISDSYFMMKYSSFHFARSRDVLQDNFVCLRDGSKQKSF